MSGGQCALPVTRKPANPTVILPCLSGASACFVSTRAARLTSWPRLAQRGKTMGLYSQQLPASPSIRTPPAARSARWCPAAGLDPDEWAPRETRQTFVSVLSDDGMPIETISDLVGHKDQTTTETVYRNSQELHQAGEKPQVSRSKNCRNSVLLVLIPVL
jgi:integrase